MIDERFDMDLLATLADARPDHHFVMVGPVVKVPESVLPRRPNIHYLGIKPYESLPAYLSGWDVALMPFALNESTRFISPTKLPEYLAAGRPVVSTPITDVVHQHGNGGGVFIAGDARAFGEAIGRALALRADDTRWRPGVDRMLADMSWDRTWNAMSAHVARARLAREGSTLSWPSPPSSSAGREKRPETIMGD